MSAGRLPDSDAAPALWQRIPPRVLISVVAVALFVVFAMQNNRTVRVTFFFWDVTTSLIWALLVAAALGAGLGLGLVRRRRR